MSFLLKSCKNHVRTIKINRPERKNALSLEMYKEITNILTKDMYDHNIVVTIITGVGEYFSSGNDMKAAIETLSDPEEKLAIFKTMVETFINYPKMLIAVVNGPAIGIGATLPALCDVVYASNKAFFDTPFVKFGLCLEGAASFTFPFILGRSKASEIIYLNHRLSAEEAYQFGLISDIIPHSQIEEFIEKLHRHGNLPVNGIILNKKLLMQHFKPILTECANRESKELYNCATSADFLERAIAFYTKSKL